MTLRTTTRSVTFAGPFVLAGVDGEHPAGTYEIEIDEEVVIGLSFPAYRRVEARISLPWRTLGSVGTQTVRIDTADLDSALARDAAAAPAR